MLTTTAPTALTVPASVTVPAGFSSVNFPISAGAISSAQSTTVRAEAGQTVVSFPIVLSPLASSLALFTCSPISVVAGGGGTCSVTLTAAAANASVISLRSTNAGLSVPVSLTVPAGDMFATLPFTTSPTITGWGIVAATSGTVTKAVKITISSAAQATSSALQLSCASRHIAAGGTAVCEIIRNSTAGADTGEFTVTSSSKRVRTPSIVRGRKGRSALRFEVTADDTAPQESVTIEARSDSGSASESLLVVSPGSLHLFAPRSRTVTPGSPVRFAVSAVDDQGLPVSVVVGSKPNGAAFDPASGIFEWIPADQAPGSTEVSFTATNSLGFTQTKTVDIKIVDVQPFIAGLRNATGEGAVAACSPGTLATLVGTSLAGLDSTGSVRVVVNGTSAPVIRASSERVDFVCPRLAPGTPLAISAEVDGLASNQVRTLMQTTAPGLFSADGSGNGFGMVLHARGLAALPRFDRAGMPAAAGDAIVLFATGINCDASPDDPKPLLYIGHTYQQVTLLRPSSFAGVCELHAVVPGRLVGNEVTLVLQTVREDGTPVRSNQIMMAVEDLN